MLAQGVQLIMMFVAMAVLLFVVYLSLVSVTRSIVARHFDRIAAKMDAVIEGQRLSTLLKIEPSSLRIDPTKFAPNKVALRKRAMTEFLNPRNWELGQGNRDPRTAAFLILDNSGVRHFLDHHSLEMVVVAFSRLIANSEMDEARKFLDEVIDQL